ncbi:hypothetical protein [Streptomyces sp. NPDC012888]|uniref:hypothetical protein n=1 Tax=Streptomyces sp. NPDC012888 TaxID=3364855 RepID=UPI0036A1E8C0
MRTHTAALALTLALLPLAACSEAEASPKACKAAMHKQYEQAKANGKEGSQPAACKGLDDATLQRLAGEVIQEQLNGANLEQDLKDLEASMDAELGTPSP